MRPLKLLFLFLAAYRHLKERVEDGVHVVRITWGSMHGKVV